MDGRGYARRELDDDRNKLPGNERGFGVDTNDKSLLVFEPVVGTPTISISR